MSELEPRPDTITDEQRTAALELIRENPNIGDARALREAGVPGTKGQLRELVADNEDLRDEIAEARGRAPEAIRAEIKRRAIEGVEEPVYTPSGKLAGTRRVYSDRLLALMARANLPEYRDSNRVQVTGPDGGPIEVSHEIDLAITRLLGDLAPRSETQAPSDPPLRALEAGGETGAATA